VTGTPPTDDDATIPARPELAIVGTGSRLKIESNEKETTISIREEDEEPGASA
jgi:hypothetical protein